MRWDGPGNLYSEDKRATANQILRFWEGSVLWNQPSQGGVCKRERERKKMNVRTISLIQNSNLGPRNKQASRRNEWQWHRDWTLADHSRTGDGETTLSFVAGARPRRWECGCEWSTTLDDESGRMVHLEHHRWSEWRSFLEQVVESSGSILDSSQWCCAIAVCVSDFEA